MVDFVSDTLSTASASLALVSSCFLVDALLASDMVEPVEDLVSELRQRLEAQELEEPMSSSIPMAAATTRSCSTMLRPTGKSAFSMATILPSGSTRNMALKLGRLGRGEVTYQRFSSALYTPYCLATSPTGSEASLTGSMLRPASDLMMEAMRMEGDRPGGGLGLPLAGDVLGGEGEEGAGQGREGL